MREGGQPTGCGTEWRMQEREALLSKGVLLMKVVFSYCWTVDLQKALHAILYF